MVYKFVSQTLIVLGKRIVRNKLKMKQLKVLNKHSSYVTSVLNLKKLENIQYQINILNNFLYTLHQYMATQIR